MTTPATPHLLLGRRGEQVAARYLVDRGLRLLSHNWRCPDGELDLILTHGSTLVFCEVKTRSSTAYGLPAEAITTQKAQRIRHLARRWLSINDLPPHLKPRFDLIAILWPPGQLPHITHTPAAF
jgi:putative endonuclease